MERYSLTSNNYVIRTEVHLGRKHIVVPVVMMVEGVHSGSHGPILHLADELGKFVESWNGIPVSIHHPEEDGSAISANHPEIIDSLVVGRVYNTIIEDGKLKAEAWIDEETINRVSPEALGYLLQARPLDVSVGVFTEDDHALGDWNGEKYEGVAKNYRPDHLALLPGGRGACSWADGCGVRNNSERGGMSAMTIYDLRKYAKDLLSRGLILVVNQVSHEEIARAIQTKLDRMDDDTKLHFLVEVYDDSFIYRVAVRSPSDTPISSADDNLFKRGYTVDDNGAVEFSGEAQPVVRKVEYVTMTEGGSNMVDKNPKEEKGCCPEKVKLLIQDERTKFTDGDRDWLLAMSEEQIDKFMPEERETSSNQEEGNTPQMNREEAIQVLKDELGDQKKFMALLPQELREQIDFGLRAYRIKRKEMTDLVIASAPEVFTADELNGKSMDDLEKLVRLAKPRGDFTPMGPAVHTSDEDMLLPHGVQ